jgi:hypothetical protein
MDTDNWLYLSIVVYSLVAVGIAAYAIVKRRARLFDPLLQCVLFISLFTLPLPVRALLSDLIEGDVTEHLPQLKPFMPLAVLYATMGLVCVAVAYYSPMSRAFGRLIPHPPIVRRPRAYFGAGTLALISLSLIFLLTVQVGGIIAFVLLGYGSSAETFGRGYLAIGFPWLFVASMLLLYRYAVYRKRRDIVLFVLAFFANVVIHALLGNRSTILYMALTAGFFVHYSIRPLTLRWILPIGVIGFLFLNIFGYLRGSKYESFADFTTRTTDVANRVSANGDLKRGWVYTLTTGEFVVPFETLPEMMRSVGTSISPRFGVTYLQAPLFVIPSAVFPDRPLPLSNWYMAQFYGNGFGLNEGRAFYFMSEGYLNFGPAGIVAIALIWGVFWGGVREYIRLARGNPGSGLLAALSVAFIFRAVAGDFSTLLIGLPEQSLSGCIIGLAIISGFASWTRKRHLSPIRIDATH